MHTPAGPSADLVLQGLETAKMTWQCLMRCSELIPADDENHREAMLLFAMSIRILLLAVQKLNSTINSHQAELCYDVAISVGSFELMGEAKAEIIGVVVRRALNAITIALQHVWEIAGQPVIQAASEYGGSPDIPSPMSILTSPSAKNDTHSRPRAFSGTPPMNGFGTEDDKITSLLATLQITMKALRRYQGSGTRPERRPSLI
ncbi:hypothetical protein N7495_006974 [Penicillium taxi]|uniref:uncharacterized protein n=1 Tax=Penicillium taxi TaxID=168475 RepID=UPI002544FAFB|nr:uncharacterized protein N7495_006974 [Penicillium taxi]KAJ5895283.1 hypothetical protein N7495_006974 [Penicillium taxi]